MSWVSFATMVSASSLGQDPILPPNPGVILPPNPGVVVPPAAGAPSLEAPSTLLHPEAPASSTNLQAPIGSTGYSTGLRYLMMCGGRLTNEADGPAISITRDGTTCRFRWDGTQWTWHSNPVTDGMFTWVPTNQSTYASSGHTQPQHRYFDAVGAQLARLNGPGFAAAETEISRMCASRDMFYRYLETHGQLEDTPFIGQRVYLFYNDREVMRFRWNPMTGQAEYSRSTQDFLPGTVDNPAPVSTWAPLSTPRPDSDTSRAATPLYETLDRLRAIAPGTAATATNFTSSQTLIDQRTMTDTRINLAGAGRTTIIGREIWTFPNTDITFSRTNSDGTYHYSLDEGRTWRPMTASTALPYQGTSLTARQTAGNDAFRSVQDAAFRSQAPVPATDVRFTALGRQLIEEAGGSEVTYVTDSNEMYIQVGPALEVYFRPVQVEGRVEWQWTFTPPTIEGREATFRPLNEFSHSELICTTDPISPSAMHALNLVEALDALQTGARGDAAAQAAAITAAESRIRDFRSRMEGTQVFSGLTQSTPDARVTVRTYPESEDTGSGTVNYTVFSIATNPVPGANPTDPPVSYYVSEFRFNEQTRRWQWRERESSNLDDFPEDWVDCGGGTPAWFPEDGDNRWYRLHNNVARLMAQYNRR